MICFSGDFSFSYLHALLVIDLKPNSLKTIILNRFGNIYKAGKLKKPGVRIAGRTNASVLNEDKRAVCKVTPVKGL
jgi:hypothetical protein